LRIRAGLPGAKVALLLERPADFIPAFWACVLGGYVPCPLAPIRGDSQRWAKHLAHVNALLDNPLFVSAGALLSELPATLSVAGLDELGGAVAETRVRNVRLSDGAILMLTSGSTGNSKAVELTHHNLLASMAGRAARQQLTSADIAFNWIAFDHVAALLESHMIALYVGATQLQAEPASILSDPLQFLRLIHRHRVSLAFAPNFLLGQINAAVQMNGLATPGNGTVALELSCLRRIVTGGEANVVETGRRFLELLAPYGLRGNALWPAFGMTETCAASVYSHEFPLCDGGREFASVGLPIAGMELRIIDEQGHASPPGAAGELQVRGPVIFQSYYNNEAATRAAFTDDGWFRTGDVGSVEEGRLCLIARNKDSIIVSGVNYYSQELETRLEQLEGIDRSFVAAFPTRPKGADTEQLVVTFATTLLPIDEEGIYQLMVGVRNTTIMLWGFRPSLILPLPREAFPKTSLGKIQRTLMRKRLEARELDHHLQQVAALVSRQAGPYVAPQDSQEKAIAAIFAEILKIDLQAVSTTASFFDLGGTSLDILRLARALQGLGIGSAVHLVLQNPTVRQLAAHVSSGSSEPRATYDPIVRLQLTGKKTPIFCVHPGNGEIFVLTNLAKYFLNDRPFFALRPPGFNEGEQRFATVDEMVSAYVDAILQRQPSGAYAIAGYSLGSQIAFEIAKELEARGKELAFLGCIDYWPCHEATKLAFNMAAALALVLDLLTKEQYHQLNRELRHDLPSDEVCEYVLGLAAPARLAELQLDLSRFARWARVAYAVETMMFSHVTSGTVSRMTVFCSEGISSRYATVEWSRKTWRDQLERWTPFASRLEYVDVPGHHHVLMAPRHLPVFQGLLRTQIELAFAERQLKT
jgi:acyl-CoA synthetase (AMP-forming)/AMP-acid ligase II/thioesterase domain-containing protein